MKTFKITRMKVIQNNCNFYEILITYQKKCFFGLVKLSYNDLARYDASYRIMRFKTHKEAVDKLNHINTTGIIHLKIGTIKIKHK